MNERSELVKTTLERTRHLCGNQLLTCKLEEYGVWSRSVDAITEAQQYITELETRLAAAEERRAESLAEIPTIQHNEALPQYDPVYVWTLQQAYNELEHVLQTAEDIIEKQAGQLKAARQWQPVKADSDEKVEMFTDGRVVVLDEDGLYYVYDLEHSEHCIGFGLPDGYAICKAQP